MDEATKDVINMLIIFVAWMINNYIHIKLGYYKRKIEEKYLK